MNLDVMNMLGTYLNSALCEKACVHMYTMITKFCLFVFVFSVCLFLLYAVAQALTE